MEGVVNAFDLANIAFKNYPETRVKFALDLMETVMVNFFALTKIDHEDFTKIFQKLSDEDWHVMQEMEAVTRLLGKYAVNESQKSDSFMNSSLKPYYRKILLKVTTKQSFNVIKLTRQKHGMALHQAERENRKVDDFTEGGKRCLHRLTKQIELRLPATTAKENLATLLDPATKLFAKKLLGMTDYQKAVCLLKEEHRSVYKLITKKKESPTINDELVDTATTREEEEDLQEPVDMDCSSDDDELYAFEPEVEKQDDAVALEELYRKSDSLVDAWLKGNQLSNDYLFDKNSKLSLGTGAKLEIKDVVSKFDTMTYFKVKGHIDHPVLCMLARIYFSCLDNSGFQERVFSTAKSAMDKSQSRMAFDQLEKRTLLAQNKRLIIEGKI